ncbi:MAG: S41 family peptidase [Clostridia bacterium]|nr:S41 family peptidase [Clostridia bacterium]
MKRIFKTIISGMLCTAMLLPMATMAQGTTVTSQEDMEALMRNKSCDYVFEIARYIDSNYIIGTNYERLIQDAFRYMFVTGDTSFDGIVNQMFEGLDKYSDYMPPEEFQSFLTDLTGNLVGIGVIVTASRAGLLVHEVLPGSGAEKAGIVRGDVIVAVNGESILDMTMNDALNLIRGEKGTTVEIGFLRALPEVVNTVSVVRSSVSNSPISETKVLEGNVGYICLDSFTENVARYLDPILMDFDDKGVKNIILDLRNNGGGAIEAANVLADRFLPEGRFVVLHTKNEAQNEEYFSHNKDVRYTLAVLVNESSASASELFSASVQDKKVGVVIGTETYGKGVAQTVRSLRTGGGIKLTTALYITDGGQDVNANKVQPDIYVENKKTVFDEEAAGALSFSVFPKEGDKSEETRAMENRLYALGYLDEADDVFDSETTHAVRWFQITQGHEAFTGEPTFQTIFDLNNIEYDERMVEEDDQLSAAISYFQNQSNGEKR